MKRIFLAGTIVISMMLTPSVQAAVTATEVIAIGDIAVAGGGQKMTARIVHNFDPDLVLLLGDLAYQQGSDQDFSNYFLPDWAQFMSHAWAVPGNHEYNTANAQGYRNLVRKYELPATGKRLWWVRNLADWTVIGLDSEAVSGASAAAQRAFIKSALKSHNRRPTIVMWHRPTFSKGQHGDAVDTSELWNSVKTDLDVKLILWGHDHDYEQASSLQGSEAKSHLLSTFVVGTGGAALRGCATPNIPGKLICGNNNFGVLKLILKPQSFSWSYRQVDGSPLGRERARGFHAW